MYSNVLQMPKPDNELNHLRYQMLTLNFHNGFAGRDFLKVATQDLTTFGKYLRKSDREDYEQRLKDCVIDRDKIAEWYKSFALEIIAEHLDQIVELIY